MFSPGLATFQKKEQAGAPFLPGSADNGLSVNAINGKMELGENPLAFTGQSDFTTRRVIHTHGLTLSLIAQLGLTAMDFQGSRIEIGTDSSITGSPAELIFDDNSIGQFTWFLNLANLSATWQILQAGGGGSGFVNQFAATGNFRITQVQNDFDNGRLLQVNGNMSLGTDVTFVIDFPNTAAQSSSDVSSALFIGALPGDAVLLGVDPGSVLPNSSFTAWVSAADTVTVRFNNYSAGAQDPPAGNFKISVIKLT